MYLKGNFPSPYTYTHMVRIQFFLLGEATHTHPTTRLAIKKAPKKGGGGNKTH